MLPRLWFKPSEVAETTRITAYCVRCGTARRLHMEKLVESDMDLPLIKIEQRLRCRDLGSAMNPRLCGQRMEIGVWVPSVKMPSGMEEDLPVLRSDARHGP